MVGCPLRSDNPRITEYAQVLHRQGERLKKLLVDLVEASKASTGNLEVHRALTELNAQAREYKELNAKLQSK